MNHDTTAASARIGRASPSFARAALGFSGSVALLCVAALALSLV